MASSSYNYMHKYLDNPSYTKPSTYSTSSPLEILNQIADDTRFDGLFDERGDGNIATLFKNHEDLILEHWNAWKIDDPNKQFKDSQDAAVALLVRTVQPGTHAYDFFMVHLLTSSHAVRTLIPLIPKRFHVSLVRQWWLLTIAVYVAQLRPKIDNDIEVKPDKQWNYVEDRSINGPWATDAHFVKGMLATHTIQHPDDLSLALRAIQTAASTWGDVHERYLAAAVRFADDFEGWAGFGPMDEAN